jgi:hypothetical protein
VIGLLRVVGVANAAVWFGTAVFHTFWIAPALASDEMQAVLGANNFPYYGGVISQLLLARYFQVNLVCAIIALLHLLAERLYLGRSWKKSWTIVIVTLFWFSLLGAVWLGPKLRDLHQTRHQVNTPPAQRAAADRSFRLWHGAFQGFNFFILVGVAGSLWRVTHPPDELRFVSSGKFRG